MMAISVSLVTAPLHESLVDLLGELHTYYNEGSRVPREVVRAHLLENLLGPQSPLRLVVAHEEGRVLGFAAIALTYSLVEPMPDQQRHCQLKELYVAATHRSAGVGKAIMAWVARYAAERGCARIDWPVKAGNANGIAFYKGLGAQQVTERLSFRISGDSLRQLADQANMDDKVNT
jgi:GNAT superfamily N-acetyltransferase